MAAGALMLLSVSLTAQDSLYYQYLSISGNRITKASVIRREVTLLPGVHYDSSRFVRELADMRNRLINLGIFNEVNLDAARDTLFVRIRDRNPVFGYPRFALADRNFNQWWETRDFSRSVYGLWMIWRNVGGWNHRMVLQLLHGYTEMIDLNYRTPFLRTYRAWSFGGRMQVTANHEVWYRTEQNRLQFLKPEAGWGQTQWYASALAAYRPKLYTWVELEPGWQHFRVADTVVHPAANARYLKDGASVQDAGWLTLRLIRDRRVRRDYPVDGSLLRAEIRPMRIMSPQGGQNHLWLSARYARYIPLSRAVLVLGAFGRYATGTLPYTYARAMGYGADYVRGYEPYVADGNGYVLFKTALRYPLWFDHHLHPEKLLPNRLLRDIPASVWLNVFADAGRVLQPIILPGNELAQRWMTGMGLGLDVLAFYDRMVRFEISLGLNNKPAGNISFINAF